MTVTGKPRKRRAKAESEPQIDLRHVLDEPVRVKQDGRSRPMPPYEAVLRQRVKKSLVDRDVQSMTFLVEQAEKHEVIKPPPSKATGGVVTIPKEVPDEMKTAIFQPWHGEGREPITRILNILMRFFRGRT